MKTFGILCLIFPALLCACRAPSAHRVATDLGQNAVVLAVLGHMVTNADDSGKVIRFVDLDAAGVEQLRSACGSRYRIFPIGMAERYTESKAAPAGSGDILPESGIRLIGTREEGVHIQAEVTRVRGTRAEALGSYHGRLSGAGFQYKLRRFGGIWKVTSSQCIYAV